MITELQVLMALAVPIVILLWRFLQKVSDLESKFNQAITRPEMQAELAEIKQDLRVMQEDIKSLLERD